MSNFIVRMWLDVKVTGVVSKEEALNEARATPIGIRGDYRVCKNGGTVQMYGYTDQRSSLGDRRMTIVILSQFTGPTPHSLSTERQSWKAFIEAVTRGDYNDTMRPPQTVDAIIAEFTCPWGCSAYREAEDGSVELFRYCWDSSG